MRIISGRFKGHRLVAFQASHIRPTTDRVKETIFNKLMADIPGATVWDLYAGTGNLGIEALSRGAAKVIFVEQNPKSIRILMQNIQKLKVEDEVQVEKRDIFKFLKTPGLDVQVDVIFVDPPFTKSLAHASMQALAAAGVRGCKIVIESKKQERIDDEYDHLILLDRKSFGDKTLSLFQCR